MTLLDISYCYSLLFEEKNCQNFKQNRLMIKDLLQFYKVEILSEHCIEKLKVDSLNVFTNFLVSTNIFDKEFFKSIRKCAVECVKETQPFK